MKQLNLYYLGGGGGGSVPDGRTVTPINDAVIWQKCAGISNPTYTSIGEILADSGMLQTLMASNNAVDYLVRCKAFIATRSLVPVMTSDNTPSGEAFADAENSPFLAYLALDGDNSTRWVAMPSSAEAAVNHYLGYDFETPTIVNKIFILPYNAGDTSSTGCRVKNYRIEASNDKVAWDILTSQTYTASNSSGDTITFTNNTAYRYYRCYVVDNITTQSSIAINALAFYSPVGICDTADAMTAIGQNNYCANTLLADATWLDAIRSSAYKESVLNAKIPIMIDNTSPKGTCTYYDSNTSAMGVSQRNIDTNTARSWTTTYATAQSYAHESFNEDVWVVDRGYAASDNTPTIVQSYLQYEFDSSIKAYMAVVTGCKMVSGGPVSTATATVKLLLRNASDLTWSQEYNETKSGSGNTYFLENSIPLNGVEIDAVKLEVDNHRVWDIIFGNIQVYGRKDV